MMKRLVVSLVALVCATVSFAQSSLLATLSHEGQVSTFYGANALTAAHAAAAHGDIITLSSGTFVATNITKAITLRGAGMEIDSVHGTMPTILTGDFTIGIADSVQQRLTLEGLYHNHQIIYYTVKNPTFMKCRFKNIVNFYDNGRLIDASFIHCRIADEFYLANNSSASCINCIIEDPNCSSGTISNFEFTNCFIKFTVANCGRVFSSSFFNCIIDGKGNNDYFPSSSIAYNCVVTNENQIFRTVPNMTNHAVSSREELYKTYQGASLEKLDSENFELTDEAKAKYLGTDGTEVGIHGGILPWDTTPSNPQITKCKVASKSTADGKLSVDIEVKAAE